MLHPTLTRAEGMKVSRFHVCVAVAFVLGSVALWLRRPTLLAAVVAAFLAIVGLGVAIPRLSLFGPFVCRGATARRWVALTFDDGPDTRSTPALLDLLRDEGVSAAFFCVGDRVAATPALAARIAREGHLLGNHSYGHSNFTNFFTLGRLRSELQRTQTVIREAAGATPLWFRPPMGLSNPRVFRAARDLGLRVIGWSVRGLDTRITDPDRIVARIVGRLEPGAIILLHDGNIPAERLVTTVKSLLDTLRARGYEVVRLDRMLGAAAQTIEPG